FPYTTLFRSFLILGDENVRYAGRIRRSSLQYPGTDSCNLLTRQWSAAFSRHEVMVGGRKRDLMQEETAVGIARCDHHAIFAPRHKRLIRIQSQTALFFIGAVARNTFCVENRSEERRVGKESRAPDL